MRSHRDSKRPLTLYKSQWVVAIPFVILFPAYSQPILLSLRLHGRWPTFIKYHCTTQIYPGLYKCQHSTIALPVWRLHNHGLINNSRTAWLTEILMPFLSFQTICFRRLISFFKKVLIILRCCTKHAQFWFEVQPSLMPPPGCHHCQDYRHILLFWH